MKKIFPFLLLIFLLASLIFNIPTSNAQLPLDNSTTVIAQNSSEEATTPDLRTSQNDILVAKNMLAQLGYYQGPVNKKDDTAFILALKSFQKDNLLDESGILDEPTKQLLSEKYNQSRKES